MTAPRLPGIGFTDGAVAQTDGGPRIFKNGQWWPITVSFGCFGIGLNDGVMVGVRIGDTLICERPVRNRIPVALP